MSKWMSIGFDPDQMDPVTTSNTQAAISGGRDDAAPWQSGGLSGLNDSSTHRIAGALKHLVARHRAPVVAEWTR